MAAAEIRRLRNARSPAAFAVARRHLALVLVALLGALPAFADEPGTISAAALASRLAAGPAVTVLDVRTSEEFATGHVPGAINVPYDQIEQRLGELDKARDHDLVAYCRTGRRSGLALATLKEKGFAHLLHLEGDLPGWQAAGNAVEATK
jgi:rhodanese-related sulfurtransferase